MSGFLTEKMAQNLIGFLIAKIFYSNRGTIEQETINRLP